MSTWFKVHREIFDSDIWNDVTTFRLFMYLMGKASHKDGVKIAGVELKRGQYLRSYRKLAADLAYKEGRGTKEYSLRTIKKAIDKLISAERVNVRETEQGTLFTILNYSKYQGSDDTEKESVNTLNSEPNTNGKRTVNNNKNAKNARINKNKDIRSKLKFETHHLQLAELLFKKIKENNPSAKEPNIESWANTFRLMMESPKEKRSGKDIQDLILWSQQHSFWYKNVLSADKIRKQFDRLYLEMKDEQKPKSNVVQFNKKEAEDDGYNYGF
ncbi:hypothetical protein GCM10011409_43360 [Lentibacillus populi]|uniref:Replication protein n=1 Tax=Lentibacillus populi TaxID=1827502 RepID=A0A9W5U1Q0_9BACI|nr:hypothetical protein [Lentibacillus populi]GGB61437.1 hypothetical protein GCM10011409_43360 [Lentibacillus populi]